MAFIADQTQDGDWETFPEYSCGLARCFHDCLGQGMVRAHRVWVCLKAGFGAGVLSPVQDPENDLSYPGR